MLKEILNQKESINQYIKADRHDLSAFSFVNIFLWHGFFTFHFHIIDETMCIFAENEMGVFMYLPPLGKDLKMQTVEECFKKMEITNRGKGITRIENFTDDLVGKLDMSGYCLKEKSQEYCYDKNDIIGLKGNKYKSQRHDYNQFKSLYCSEYRNFESEDKEACCELYDIWARSRLDKHGNNDIYSHMIEENKLVHKRVFEHAVDLDLIGKVVLIDGRIKGYTFGYEINPDMFCILLEITDPEVKGISSYIFREFCSDNSLKQYDTINTMDDMFLDNIRDTKESYHPKCKIKSYTLIKK